MTTLTAKTLRSTRLTAGGQRRGFTLIELLVTMAVIAILAGILLPVIHIARVQAKAASTKTLLAQIVGALGRYNEDWGHFPPDKIGASGSVSIVKFVGYDPKAAPPSNYFSATCQATGESLYYYLANPNITRKHPYLELQADVQFKMWDYSSDYDDNKLRFVCDSWERPFLYNRPRFAGQADNYFNLAGDPIHHVSTYDLFSTGPNGQTALMNLPHPRSNYPGFNNGALNTASGYGLDNDDIASWK
ncbi:type II secretion system protein [Planctomycetota bacterium]